MNSKSPDASEPAKELSLFDMLEVLMEDVEQADPSKTDSPSDRRQYVRAVFAFIEGAVALLKQSALDEVSRGWVEFSAAELTLLREEQAELNDRGQPRVRPSFIQLTRNLQFAFNCFAKANGFGITLPLSDNGWAAFQRAVILRNRLMHPKAKTDLEVSDSDLLDARHANIWFTTCLMVTLEAGGKSAEHRAEQMRKSAELLRTRADRLRRAFGLPRQI